MTPQALHLHDSFNPHHSGRVTIRVKYVGGNNHMMSNIVPEADSQRTRRLSDFINNPLGRNLTSMSVSLESREDNHTLRRLSKHQP
jgi:hypothetical protein